MGKITNEDGGVKEFSEFIDYNSNVDGKMLTLKAVDLLLSKQRDGNITVDTGEEVIEILITRKPISNYEKLHRHVNSI